MTPQRLSRARQPEWAAPPVRIVHVGLGGFFRAHTAWYTARAADAGEWGIAAFSGQSTDLARRLAAQDGLYTLTVRGPAADSIEVIPSVVATHPGTDRASWLGYLSNPDVGIVTLTVTEAAYGTGPDSVGPRLLDGFVARRRADAGPITVVGCDNVENSADVLDGLIDAAARAHGGGLAGWVAESVRVHGSVVDRITPRPIPADIEAAARRGFVDQAPVVTEAYSEWVIGGSIASDHPDWESAGVTFSDDLGPYARRKLHLLNGAHSLLAYVGQLRGHTEVADAMRDPVLHDLVEAWWDEATVVVGGDPGAIAPYRAALLERFSNPRIHHRLAQIAIDGSAKLPIRVVPVAVARRAAGRDAPMAALIIGAWIAYVRAVGTDLTDARAGDVIRAVTGRLDDATRRAVDVLAPELAEDPGFVAAVIDASVRFSRDVPQT